MTFNTLNKILIFPVTIALSGCHIMSGKRTNVLYKSESFTVFSNAVEQGNNRSTIRSSESIQSNYLSPVDTSQRVTQYWQLKKDISNKASYSSQQPIVDALFKLSTEEALKNIEKDSTLRTGAQWGGIWTRDISYSIYLAFAYQEPEVAKISLLKKVKRGRIIQDTGSGGSWPVSSDRVIWANAAWEIYKITGDRNWLKQSYEIVRTTLSDDDKTIKDTNGLYKGESSFLDWREQTYPVWMSNLDIGESENLGTNVIQCRAYDVLGKMAHALGEPSEKYFLESKNIRKAINLHLWQENKGYYGQYLYGGKNKVRSGNFEALGEALAVIFNVADSVQAKMIIANSPVTAFGVPTIYPQIKGIPNYHNNAVWPFVQSYWNLAAAKTGNEALVNYGLAALYRPTALFLTNYENFVLENGDYNGTEMNSNRMLWSIAGNLAMVHRLLMGMEFEENGISFHPVVPKNYGGKKQLSNFHYRKAILDILVTGEGNFVSSFKIDGKPLANAFFDGSLPGKHLIEISLSDGMKNEPLHIVKNKFAPQFPEVYKLGSNLNWQAIPDAKKYLVYEDGKKVAELNNTSFPFVKKKYSEYRVSVVDNNGLESFTSKPVKVFDSTRIIKIEVENFAPMINDTLKGYSGKGVVEVNTDKNLKVDIKVVAEQSGNYLAEFRYSNGSGFPNFENKCAIRTLYNDDKDVGIFIFPMIGKGAWSDWNMSNALKVHLQKGENKLSLRFEDWNNNMNVKINTAMLDYLQLVPLD